jgi:peptidoglycan/LPS O-acetylase OafA/YrhL
VVAPVTATRVRQLDVLRGLAVILVLGRHMQLPSDAVARPIRAVAAVWYQVGWTGIDLFFVLSGFLISGLLFTEYQKHGTLRIGQFLIRRGFKIYPAFYVMLAATVVATAYHSHLPSGYMLRVLTEAVYLQNYLPPVWGPTWSLAVEEHFYLLLALALFLMVRRGSREDPFRTLVFVIAGVAAMALSLRIYTTLAYPYSERRNFFPTHLRLDAIAWGALLGYWYHFQRRRLLAFVERRRWLIALASVVLIAPPFLWPLGQSRFLSTLGLTLLDWGFAGVLILALTIPAPSSAVPPSVPRWARLGPGLAAIGLYSYSIYLWHMPVMDWLMPHLRRHGTLALPDTTMAWTLDFAVYAIASIACGYAMARVVEGPALMLRDRLFPSRSGRLAAVAPPPPPPEPQHAAPRHSAVRGEARVRA